MIIDIDEPDVNDGLLKKIKGITECEEWPMVGVVDNPLKLRFDFKAGDRIVDSFRISEIKTINALFKNNTFLELLQQERTEVVQSDILFRLVAAESLLEIHMS